MPDKILDASYVAIAACRILILSVRHGKPIRKKDLRTALDLATLAVSLDEGRKKRK